MSSTKDEQLYKKQIRHLMDEIKRCEESIQQKENDIKLNRAKCSAVEQDTRAIIEYLEFDVSKKQQRLVEIQEQHEQQKEEFRQELQEIDDKHAHSIQKLQDELEELTTKLPKLDVEHAEILEDLQKQIQSRKNLMAQNQRDFDTNIREAKEEELDPDMVARILKDTEQEGERRVSEEFCDCVSNTRELHQIWRKDRNFLQDVVPRVSQKRDLLRLQLTQDKQSKQEMDGILEEAAAQNIVREQKAERLRERREELEKQVQNLRLSLEDHKPHVKIEQKRLVQRMAKISRSREKQNEEIDRLTAAIQAVRNRTTELRMAMKEADIVFKHITEDQNVDLQKLKRLHTILESYAPRRKL